MFTRLVASQPTHERAVKGFMFSTLLHGSLIAAAVLLTSTESFETLIDEPREITIALPRPQPEPTPVERTAPVSAPDAPTIVTRAPVVEHVVSAPTTVPTTIPDRSELPWTSIADAPTGVGLPGGSAGTESGVPMTGPSGAYSEAYVDVPVSLDARSPLPRYPDALRKWRTEGVARLTFVVDTLGRVEMETVKVVESSHPAFAAAVKATLPRMRFSAARIGARRVRQLVEFPIVFRLEP